MDTLQLYTKILSSYEIVSLNYLLESENLSVGLNMEKEYNSI